MEGVKGAGYRHKEQKSLTDTEEFVPSNSFVFWVKRCLDISDKTGLNLV